VVEHDSTVKDESCEFVIDNVTETEWLVALHDAIG
jgi:hypothetical protein